MRYLFFLILPFFAYAQTTMCFKNNWSDPATIETQKFLGGVCDGKKSISEMKKEGWSIDDIKISSSDEGMNFIYILKKQETKTKKSESKNLDYEHIAKTLKDKEEENQKQKDIQEGKNYYKKICEQCHGKKGELEAYGKSRKLKDLSLKDMKFAIRGYMWDEYDRGRALTMKPYAQLVTNARLEQIKVYLDSINK